MFKRSTLFSPYHSLRRVLYAKAYVTESYKNERRYKHELPRFALIAAYKFRYRKSIVWVQDRRDASRFCRTLQRVELQLLCAVRGRCDSLVEPRQ
jgi:hypothetical protein